MKKLIAVILLGVLGALLGPYVYRYFRVYGYHNSMQANKHRGTCRTIPGIETGSEDFELLPNGKVLITAGTVLPPGMHAPNIQGQFLLLDLNEAEPTPIQVPIKGDLDINKFRPLGITKWINKKVKKITIMVANIAGPRATVERFVFSEVENIMYHVETIGEGDPNFYLVDDLVAVGERSFYYTNLHGEHLSWEMTYFLPWGSVGYYNGKSKKSMLVDEGCAGPNGIAMSPDRKYVYVNMTFDEYMRTYERQSDNTLKQIQDYQTNVLADNVMVTDDGDAWVAGTYMGWKMLELFNKVEGATVPFKIIRLTMKDGKVTSSQDVFADDGSMISGVSVGVVHNKKLLIGTIMWNATLCDLSSDSDYSENE